MSRELSLDEQERDEYQACMLQHADDLALYQAERAKSIVEICDEHGRWPCFDVMDECPGCLNDEAALKDARRERFDHRPIPRKPAA